MPDIAIITALEREVRPLVNGPGWRRTTLIPAPYGCFQTAGALVVCAGIGGGPAHRAAEAVLAVVQPQVLVSAGLAGALVADLGVGEVLVPRVVVDTAGMRRFQINSAFRASEGGNCSVLVSASGVASPEAKRLLAAQYHAQSVDMEAGAVAAVAAAQRTPFLCVKAISDEYDFPMPDMQAYVTPDGRFQTSKFVLAVACRPSLWGIARRLRANTEIAAQKLSRVLQQFLHAPVDQVAIPRLITVETTAACRETTA